MLIWNVDQFEWFKPNEADDHRFRRKWGKFWIFMNNFEMHLNVFRPVQIWDVEHICKSWRHFHLLQNLFPENPSQIWIKPIRNGHNNLQI